MPHEFRSSGRLGSSAAIDAKLGKLGEVGRFLGVGMAKDDFRIESLFFLNRFDDEFQVVDKKYRKRGRNGYHRFRRTSFTAKP